MSKISRKESDKGTDRSEEDTYYMNLEFAVASSSLPSFSSTLRPMYSRGSIFFALFTVRKIVGSGRSLLQKGDRRCRGEIADAEGRSPARRTGWRCAREIDVPRRTSQKTNCQEPDGLRLVSSLDDYITLPKQKSC